MIYGFFKEYRWLSNFWFSTIDCGDWVFPTVEHAYQAFKSDDPQVWKAFSLMVTPGEAKRAGKTVILRANWEERKLDVMSGLIEIKFEQHLDLRAKLVATGTQELVEANTWGDQFWGVDQHSKVGHNHLGKILMAERSKWL